MAASGTILREPCPSSFANTARRFGSDIQRKEKLPTVFTTEYSAHAIHTLRIPQNLDCTDMQLCRPPIPRRHPDPHTHPSCAPARATAPSRLRLGLAASHDHHKTSRSCREPLSRGRSVGSGLLPVGQVGRLAL